MSHHARGLRGRTGRRRRAQTGCGQEQRALVAAGKPKSRCHASGVAYEGGRTGGRVQAITPQSGVTASSSNDDLLAIKGHRPLTYHIIIHIAIGNRLVILLMNFIWGC